MKPTLALLCLSLLLPPAALAADLNSLAGSYNLTDVAHPEKGVQTFMIVTPWPPAGAGAFLVRGDGWVGEGQLNADSGYYDWRFDNGSQGRTTFTVESSGCLRGHVSGSGIDWTYEACHAPAH